MSYTARPRPPKHRIRPRPRLVRWRFDLVRPEDFTVRGSNYVAKMAADTNFLATGMNYLKERLALELGTGNPFALPCAPASAPVGSEVGGGDPARRAGLGVTTARKPAGQQPRAPALAQKVLTGGVSIACVEPRRHVVTALRSLPIVAIRWIARGSSERCAASSRDSLVWQHGGGWGWGAGGGGRSAFRRAHEETCLKGHRMLRLVVLRPLFRQGGRNNRASGKDSRGDGRQRSPGGRGNRGDAGWRPRGRGPSAPRVVVVQARASEQRPASAAGEGAESPRGRSRKARGSVADSR